MSYERLPSKFTNPMDAAGELIVGGPNGSPTAIAPPGAGYVVASSSATSTGFTNTPSLIGNTAELFVQANGSGDNASFEGYSTTVNNAPSVTFARSKNATIGSQTIVANNDPLGMLNFKGSNGTGFAFAAQISVEVDGTPGATNDMPGRIRFLTSPDASATPAEVMRLTNAKYALIGITSANTAGAKLQVVDGITFPATQVGSTDPNTLDDYEEGTWTPAIIGSTTPPTGTGYTSRLGYYQKMGNRVYLYVNCVGTITGKGTGNIQLASLPFNTPPVAWGESSGANVGFAPVGSYVGFNATNSAIATINFPTVGAAIAPLPWANASVSATNFQIIGAFSYTTNT